MDVVDVDGVLLCFIPGMTSPRGEGYYISYIDQAKEVKRRLSEIAKKYGLRWWGDVRRPVVLRFCPLDKGNIEGFLTDLVNFYEEVGYAEI